MDKGSITSLIGPNGAGKTTLFNCVTGMYRPSGGRVAFEGADITGESAHQVSRHGIARTFQNLALFGGLSVLENLLVGAYRQGASGLMGGAFLSPRARAEQRAAEADAIEVLNFLGMPETADVLPGELPYGRQKQVEFARALMQKARLVLLDEPIAWNYLRSRISLVSADRQLRSRRNQRISERTHSSPRPTSRQCFA